MRRSLSLLVIAVVAILWVWGCSATTTDAVPASPPVATPAASASMTGLFTYMADAALFTDCRTGDRRPVAMEADYLALERAYLESRTEPGAALLVEFTGSVESRPAMEGDGTEKAVIVTRFERVLPGESCAPVQPKSPLRSTAWVFRSVRGRTMSLGAGHRRPSVVFREDDDQIRGFAGCNQIGASFTLIDHELSFGPITSTRMQCSPTPTMEVERNIIRALETTASYRIEGNRLTLFNAKGVEMSVLEAQNSATGVAG